MPVSLARRRVQFVLVDTAATKKEKVKEQYDKNRKKCNTSFFDSLSPTLTSLH